MYNSLIFTAIDKLDWQKIKYVHNVLNIKWVSEEQGNVYEHEPSLEELREELFLIMKFVISKDIPILECGNWLVIWNNEERALISGYEGPRVEAFFIVAESYATERIENIDTLHQMLKDSLADENYENAAKIRDKINSLSKK